MKKILFCAFLLSAMHPAFSQLYIRASIGYNLPLAADEMGVESHTKRLPDQSLDTHSEVIYGSYGSGFSADVAFGGKFGNSQLGYDLGLSYLFGRKINVNSTNETYTDFVGYTYFEYYARSFQFSPSITFTSEGDKVQPFARFGPVLAMTKLFDSYDQTYSEGDPRRQSSYELTGNLSVGIKGAVGVSYPISSSLKLFGEFDFIGMSYAPTKRTTTGYWIDGADHMSDIDPEDIEIDLEKEYKNGGSEYIEDREKYTMSSWGLKIGVIFSLSPAAAE